MNELGLRTLTPGLCWWCDSPADSREHKLKRSDLQREFGRPPYYGARTLQRITVGGSQEMNGPGSPRMKFRAAMCARCNNERSQPFDTAWDCFVSALVDNEPQIVESRSVDLRLVFGDGWRTRSLDVARYLVKHAICRIVQELPGPIRLERSLFTFLDGGPYPDALQLDACLDLGVVAMLQMTRSAPSVDPQAAAAGFLHLGAIFGELDESQCWHTPQAGMHYRWLAFYWRVGDGGAQNPFAQQRISLRPSDQLFGPEFREFLALERLVPAKVLDQVKEGMLMHEVVRAAGYVEIADKMQALTERIVADRESRPTIKAFPEPTR